MFIFIYYDKSNVENFFFLNDKLYKDNFIYLNSIDKFIQYFIIIVDFYFYIL